MPRVKCPHCGAGNQDATESDTCWQCGKVLGAPTSAGQSEVARAQYVEQVAAPTVQLDPSQAPQIPTSYRPARAASATGGNRGTLPVILALIVLAIVIVIAIIALR